MSSTIIQNLLQRRGFHFDGHRFRRRFVRVVFSRLFRSAEAGLVEAGELDANGIHRILAVRPNHRLGNIVLLTPLIVELERTFPGAEIDILVAGDIGYDIFVSYFSIRRVHALPHYVWRFPLRVLKAILSLRRAHYDLAIDPCADSNSSRLLLACVRPRLTLGAPLPTSEAYQSWARLLFSAPRHLATFPVFLLRHAMRPARQVDESHYPPLDIRLTYAERRAGWNQLDALLRRPKFKQRPYTIGIFANASGAKCFDEEWWLRFLRPLIDEHPESMIVEFVPADGHSRLGGHFPTHYSSCPRKLASVIANLNCFISGDCGVMHLASASGTPTLGLFSVTDSSMYEPYGHCNLALDTSGKMPEQVARSAARFIRAACRTPFDERRSDSATLRSALVIADVDIRRRCTQSPTIYNAD